MQTNTKREHNKVDQEGQLQRVAFTRTTTRRPISTLKDRLSMSSFKSDSGFKNNDRIKLKKLTNTCRESYNRGQASRYRRRRRLLMRTRRVPMHSGSFEQATLELTDELHKFPELALCYPKNYSQAARCAQSTSTYDDRSDLLGCRHIVRTATQWR